jgi:hypothetical protein
MENREFRLAAGHFRLLTENVETIEIDIARREFIFVEYDIPL